MHMQLTRYCTAAELGQGPSRKLRQALFDPYGYGDFNPYSAGQQPGFVNVDINRETGTHFSIGGVTVDQSADGNYFGFGLGDLFGFGVSKDRGYNVQLGGGSLMDLSVTRDAGLGLWILDGLININLGPNSASWIAEPIVAAGNMNAQVVAAPISATGAPITSNNAAGPPSSLPSGAIIPAAIAGIFGAQLPVQPAAPSVTTASVPAATPAPITTGMPVPAPAQLPDWSSAIFPQAAATVYSNGAPSMVVSGSTGGGAVTVQSPSTPSVTVSSNGWAAAPSRTGSSSSSDSNAFSIQGMADNMGEIDGSQPAPGVPLPVSPLAAARASCESKGGVVVREVGTKVLCRYRQRVLAVATKYN
jgi:hypothetical protein